MLVFKGRRGCKDELEGGLDNVSLRTLHKTALNERFYDYNYFSSDNDKPEVM